MPSRLVRVRGVRGSLPQGVVIGRSDRGPGAAQLISLSDLAQQVATVSAAGNTPGHDALSHLTDVTLTTLTTSDVLTWNGTKWTNLPPSDTDSLASLTDVTLASLAAYDFFTYDGAHWVNHRQHYDIAFSVPAAPAAGQTMEHQFSKAVTIPANFAAYLGRASQAGGTANATASTVFTVKRALAASPTVFATVGTVTIAAGTVTPTFATSGGVAISFAQSDTLQVVCPLTPDATFAGLRLTFCGYET